MKLNERELLYYCIAKRPLWRTEIGIKPSRMSVLDRKIDSGCNRYNEKQVHVNAWTVQAKTLKNIHSKI